MQYFERIIRFLLKRWWLIILIFLLVPVIVNSFMKPFWAFLPINSEGDLNSWINFWGNYTGGVLGALIGGIVAYYIAKTQIVAQLKSEQEKYTFDRKMNIFKTIMENRSFFIGNQVPNYDLVKALNQIEIEFYENQNVINAWKNLHLTLSTTILPDSTQDILNAFFLKKNELFVNILFEMTISLDLKMKRDSIINSVYLPDSYTRSVTEQLLLKQKVESLLDGKTSLSVEIKKVRENG